MPMKAYKKTIRMIVRGLATGLVLLGFCGLSALPAAAEPIGTTPQYTFAGNIDFVGTGGSLRTQPNYWNACAIASTSTAALSGIPAGATIRAACLYWARSGNVADNRVSLNGNTVDADRAFNETFVNGGTTYRFRSAMADVTSIVNTTRNGNYTFGGLTISTDNPWCPVEAVLGGWALVVIYEDASEKERVINIYDGFQYFWNSSITLTPSNFVVSSASGIDGKIGHISWEGDPTISGANEYLRFNGTTLTDANNPATDQYNSTFSHLGTLVSSPTYGVDFDVYDISSYLTVGDNSATAVYSAAGDLVMLSAEIISVTCQAADLSIAKTHSGGFVSGGPGDFTITVTNSGPNSISGVVTVSDTLPAGLTYNSFSGTGWAVDTSAAPTILFTYDCSASPLAVGASLPALKMTVTVGAAAVPSVSNTATVSSSSTFDHVSANNADTDTVAVSAGADIAVAKTVNNTTPGMGDTIVYTITATNTGATNTGNVAVTDALPSGVTHVSSTVSQGAYNSGTGAWSVGNLNVGATAILQITAAVDNGTGGDTITNTATFTGSDYPDPVAANDSAGVDITVPVPDLLAMKTVTTFSDPTGGANPKAIPGAVMIYTIQVTNQGPGSVDADSVRITDAIPANTKLFVGDLGDGPIVFLDGSAYGDTDSGLDPYNFVALDNDTDDLGFSNDNGTTFTYHPTPDGDDCDENVTDILVNPKGPMDGAASGNTPSFQIRFRVQVE